MDVIIFADEDDVGVQRLVEALDPVHQVVWWKFGLFEDVLSADVSLERSVLSQPGARLTSEDFLSSKVVLYRRRFHYDRPVARSRLEGEAERAFSEREWKSLVVSLLLNEESRSSAMWVNSVKSSLVGENKLFLMLDAANAGFNVPPFRIGAPAILPSPSDSGSVVIKAVSADERIDEKRYLTTTEIDSVSARRIVDSGTSTPILLQPVIRSSQELRVYYLLGSLLALELQRSSEHVDIRYTEREQMAPQIVDLDREISLRIHKYASNHDFQFFALDFLVDEWGALHLVDVTPNGSWDYFEADEKPQVSEVLASFISRYLSDQVA